MKIEPLEDGYRLVLDSQETALLGRLARHMLVEAASSRIELGHIEAESLLLICDSIPSGADERKSGRNVLYSEECHELLARCFERAVDFEPENASLGVDGARYLRLTHAEFAVGLTIPDYLPADFN